MQETQETQVRSLVGFDPWVGRSLGGGNSNLLQYSCPENSKDGEPGRLQSMGPQRVRHNRATEQQQKQEATGGVLGGGWIAGDGGKAEGRDP